jgi:exosome complex component RRP46
MTLTSVSLALNSDESSRNIIRSPNLLEFQSADSVHVLAFTSRGQLLVAESEGRFSMEDWDEVYRVGKEICCDSPKTDADDNVMQKEGLDEKTGSMTMFVRSILQDKVMADNHWKD